MTSASTACGLSWLGYPQFLQRFANTKTFIFVYGLLGTFQAMGYIYFVITLQTVEKRFKIPSQTTGLILSGNEISQILLSVILAYVGGQRNRPRFIAWGVVFCAISCFILALPHFIYGPGEDALKLTKEFAESTNSSMLDSSEVDILFKKSNRLCMAEPMDKKCDDAIESILPLVLIFLSQFVLGIGNTLYYALGQTYLDDNTKKTNTPVLLSYAFAMRTFGPAVGFVLGYASLKMYIDPSKTPLIDSKDPRWLGAWWFGWTVLGFAMLAVSVLVGMFPKELPKKKEENSRPISNNMPKILLNNSDDIFSGEDSRPLNNSSDRQIGGSMVDVPTFKQLPAAMKRLFTNKLLMCNVVSGIFYILGASPYMTFMSKYLEVQFHKNAADAMIVTGPFTIIGVCVGFLASGYIISKKKPRPSKLLFWNVIVGFGYMAGQISYLYLTCPDGETPLVIHNGKINLTTDCNSDCYCSGFSYTPVCREDTGDTFFNPCIASCKNYSKEEKIYHGCECARDPPKTSHFTHPLTTTLPTTIKNKPQSQNISTTVLTLSTELSNINSTFSTASEATTTTNAKTFSSTPSSPPSTVLQNAAVGKLSETSQVPETTSSESVTKKPYNDFIYDEDYDDESIVTNDDETKERKRRSSDDTMWGVLTPGACIKGCAFGFYTFSIVSSVINCFGASGRIGNLLVNYRCVSQQDKSVTQGLILMLISLFALIPGPIIFGRIIDQTCLVWTEDECTGRRGNCQFYDQRLFRYYINLTSFCLTAIGVFFDILVWKFGRNLDLYGEREEEMLKKRQNDSRNGRN